MSLTLAAATPNLLPALLAGIQPHLPWLLALLAVTLLLSAPLPGRGPGVMAKRDP